MTNVQLTLIFSKYLVQFRFSFSIISLIFTVIVHDALLMAKVECFWGK